MSINQFPVFVLNLEYEKENSMNQEFFKKVNK